MITGPITAAASEPQYLSAIAPVWRVLDPALRGEFMVPDHLFPDALARGVAPSAWRQPSGIGLVASERDLRLVAIPSILMEHGAGQSYSNDHASYAGGARENVIMFLVPGLGPAKRNRASHPSVPVVEIGNPRLDDLRAIPSTGEDAIAVAFHWAADAGCAESGTAWYAWRDHLDLLAERGRVLGHGHPRAFQELSGWYRAHGIEAVESYEEIVARARVLVADNTSIMYDWAALDRPVVALNSPTWNRRSRHGLRFWDAIPGPQVDAPADLLAAFDKADDRASRRARAKAARAAYTHLSGGAKVAAEAIERLIRA